MIKTIPSCTRYYDKIHFDEVKVKNKHFNRETGMAVFVVYFTNEHEKDMETVLSYLPFGVDFLYEYDPPRLMVIPTKKLTFIMTYHLVCQYRSWDDSKLPIDEAIENLLNDGYKPIKNNAPVV